MADFSVTAGAAGTATYAASIPEFSNWQCFTFGCSHESPGIVWRPFKNGEPNWFWRQMQFLCFGNRWVKVA